MTLSKAISKKIKAVQPTEQTRNAPRPRRLRQPSLSIFSFGNSKKTRKQSKTKKSPLALREAKDAYEKQNGWDKVKHSREPLTKEGKRWF